MGRPHSRVKVALHDGEGVKTQVMRQMVNHPLDPHNPLRPAKATIGGGRLGIGFQTVAFDTDIGDPIAIVGMQHGAVSHGKREVLAIAAAHKMDEIDCDQPTLRIGPRFVADFQIVALARDHHVIVTVIAHFARLARGMGCNRAGHGQSVALAFLTAKTAPHPPHLYPHRRHGQMQGVGHFVLNFGGMLGRGDDVHTIFLRDGGGNLAFKVEMLLATHLKLALDHHCGLGHIGQIATAPDDRALFKARIGGKGLFHSQKRWQRSIGDFGQTGGFARLKVALRHNQKHRLAGVMHFANGQQGFVMHSGRDIGHIGQVFGRKHRHYAGGRTHRCQIKGCDVGMGLGG